VRRTDKTRMAFRYRLDRKIRGLVMKIMNWITPSSCEERVNFRRQNIKRILLIRSLFRMGESSIMKSVFPLTPFSKLAVRS
jgi:hypothetical protein